MRPTFQMTCRQLGAVLTMFACVAYVQPGLRVAVAQTPPQTAKPANAQAVSVTVLEADGKTPVNSVPVRLRSIDSGTIAGQGITDTNGRVSLSAPPGLYVVEAVNSGGGVIAVSSQVVVNVGPVSTTVTLPQDEGAAAFFTSTLFLVLAGAGTAGILVLVATDPDSPEQ